MRRPGGRALRGGAPHAAPRIALRKGPASVVSGRSLTCPSPSSMTRHAPSARRARSAVTNGRPRDLTSGVSADRSMPGGGSPGGSGCAVTSRQVAADPPGAGLRRGEMLEPAQHEAAGELILAQLTEPGRHRPRRRGVREVGDVGGLVPVVLHRLDVVAQHRRPGPRRSHASRNPGSLSSSVHAACGVIWASAGYQPGSSCACRYWAALVRSVTPLAARASASMPYWAARASSRGRPPPRRDPGRAPPPFPRHQDRPARHDRSAPR